jgi:hypothetical protein
LLADAAFDVAANLAHRDLGTIAQIAVQCFFHPLILLRAGSSAATGGTLSIQRA